MDKEWLKKKKKKKKRKKKSRSRQGLEVWGEYRGTKVSNLKEKKTGQSGVETRGKTLQRKNPENATKKRRRKLEIGEKVYKKKKTNLHGEGVARKSTPQGRKKKTKVELSLKNKKTMGLLLGPRGGGKTGEKKKTSRREKKEKKKKKKKKKN